MTDLPRRSAMALLVLLGGVACAPGPMTPGAGTMLPPLRSDTSDANAFATVVLDRLQPRSITESREYCGIILRADDDSLYTSPIAAGNEFSCKMPSVIGEVVATFHTHGSYSPEFENELPSLSDVLGDFSQRIDGYVATPAGRVWLNDYSERQVVLLCGEGCITADPRTDPNDGGLIPVRLTVDELRAHRPPAT